MIRFCGMCHTDQKKCAGRLRFRMFVTDVAEIYMKQSLFMFLFSTQQILAIRCDHPNGQGE